MISITLLLLLAAFVVTMAHSLGKAPLWVAVLLLIIVILIGMVPIR